MSAATAEQVRGSRPPLWRDVRVLRLVFQVVVVGAVVGLVLWLYGNLTTNLSRQNIRTDFGYLDQSAGFAIADSDFRSSQPVWRALVVGIKNTAIVAVVGIVLASILGILVGVARLSSNWLVRRAASFYVEAIRNIPVVVIILFIFLAVILKLPRLTEASEWLGASVISNNGVWFPSLASPQGAGSFPLLVLVALIAAVVVVWWRTSLFDRTGTPHHRVLWGVGVFAGIVAVSYVATGGPVELSLPSREGRVVVGGIKMPPGFTALLAGLVIYTASHIAEIVRGSILAVPKGQTEAGRAVGLTEFQRYRFVVLPQALRIMIPPLANQYLNLTKNSSLAVFVAFPEVTRLTDIIISQGGPAPQGILLLMGIYLVFSFTIAAITNLINRRLQLVTR